MAAADLFGLSLFQLMQVRLSSVEGAASQIILMLTSIAYMPGLGIALGTSTAAGYVTRDGNITSWLNELAERAFAKDTELAALVAQDPGTIGKFGVDEAVTALEGGQNTKDVQTGFTIITQENLNGEGGAAAYKSNC